MASDKVELGVPLYGRDFSRHGSVSLFGNQATAVARRHHVRPHWNRKQQEWTYHYRSHGVRHTVWFGGPRGAAARTRLARASRLGGAAFWAAGLDMTGTWKAVRKAR